MSNLMDVTGTCPCCRETWSVVVSRAAYSDWQSGTLIQDAMPDVNPSQREQLISGTCPNCFAAMYALNSGETNA